MTRSGRSRRRGLLDDRERRGVRGEHGGGLHDRVERAPQLELRVEALDDRLDDHVARSEVLGVDRALDAGADRRGVLRRRPALVDRAVEQRTDGRQAAVERALIGVEQHDVVAGLGGDLGDSVPHEPGAHDADLLDVRHLRVPPV